MFSKRNLVTILLVSALVAAQGVLWAGQNGIFDYAALKEDLAASKARNERLGARNQGLVEDVVDLKSRADAIEEMARNRLGMIRSGEIFYRVIETQ